MTNPICPYCGYKITSVAFNKHDVTFIRLKWNDGDNEWTTIEEPVGVDEKIECPNCGKDITGAISIMGVYTWIPKYIVL